MQHLKYRVVFLESELKSWGNSYGLRVSKETAEKLGIRIGDPVQVNIVKSSKKVDGFGICRGARSFKRDPHDDY